MSEQIFTGVFNESIARINPDIDREVLNRVLEEVTLSLDYEDLSTKELKA